MSLPLECPAETCSWLVRLEASVSEELLPSAGATAARALILRVDAIRDALAQAEAGAIVRQLAQQFPGVRGLLTLDSSDEYNDQGGTFRCVNVRFDPDEAAECVDDGADDGADYGNDIEFWLEDQCVAHDLYAAAASALGCHVDDQDSLSVMIDPQISSRSDLSARQLFLSSCSMGRQRVIGKRESAEHCMASPAVAQEASCSI